MIKKIILGALAFLSMNQIGVVELYAKDLSVEQLIAGQGEAGESRRKSEKKPVVPAQLEQCGAFKNTAPWCDESLEGDTRQLQAAQISTIMLQPEAQKEWIKLHREKRRGVEFITTNDKGEEVKAFRPVIHAVARVIMVPASGNLEEAMLYQALLSPDMTTATLLLPAEGNFTGGHVYVISSEGTHAITTDGRLIKLGGRHRKDGNLEPDFSQLPSSQLSGTTLVQRGDGSGLIETLQAMFVEHRVVHDRDGSVRVYSGLQGMSDVLAMYSNCRTAGQRVLEKGNLQVDTGSILAVATTDPIGLAFQGLQNLFALTSLSCR